MNSFNASVAVCTYNGEKFIEDQLNSIVNQTIKPCQIVISDDSSKDRTIEIAEAVLRKSGIDYVININKPGLGITKNFDKSFTLCKGDIIFPSDQDNVWEENYIESMLQVFAEDSTLNLVYCNGYVTDENLNRIKPTFSDSEMNVSDKETFLRKAVTKQFFPHGHTIAVKRDFAVRSIPSGFYYDEWLTMCASAERSVGSVNKNLVNFRRHAAANSPSEGGGDQNNVLQQINKKNFDQYFIWPGLQSEAYHRFLELHAKDLPTDLRNEITAHADFEKGMDSLKNINLLKRECRLCKLFLTSEYRKYRGNHNTFICDLLFLLKKSRF